MLTELQYQKNKNAISIWYVFILLLNLVYESKTNSNSLYHHELHSIILFLGSNHIVLYQIVLNCNRGESYPIALTIASYVSLMSCWQCIEMCISVALVMEKHILSILACSAKCLQNHSKYTGCTLTEKSL